MSAPAVAVRERPILFSAPMVRAILAGTKTQTRRIVKGTALEWLAPGMFSPEYVALPENHLCPYGAPGDRLWVRETFHACPHCAGPEYRPPGRPTYRADGEDGVQSRKCLAHVRWRPSIFMPRWACRLTLDLTGVRVERLQDISEADAQAEGVERHDDDGVTYYGPLDKGHASAIDEYRRLWDSLNAKRGYGWDAAPWVWVLTFRRVEDGA